MNGKISDSTGEKSSKVGNVRFEPARSGQPMIEVRSRAFTVTTLQMDTDGDRAGKFDSGVSLDQKDKEVTEYDRALNLLATDATYQKEVSMGKRIALYKLGRELGSGNFAKVKAGVHVLAKEKVAVKIIDRGKIDQKSMKLLAREIANMDELHHPNVIQLFEVIETMSKMYLVMEMAGGGELYQYVLDKERLDEAEAAHIFAQVVAAVYHLHEHLIIHRDIKAENVFFVSPGWVKLGDLGFSAQIEPGALMKTFCGSPPYAAPELFRDAEYQGEYVDIWALGIMLYFLVVGNTPFRGDTVSELKRLILDGYFTIPESITPFCQDMINGILKMQPTSRMNLNDIMVGDCAQFARVAGALLAVQVSLPDCRRQVVGDAERGGGPGQGQHDRPAGLVALCQVRRVAGDAQAARRQGKQGCVTTNLRRA